MSKRDKVRDYLTNDLGLNILRTIDRLNPIELPTSRLCTVKEVSEAANLPMKETWNLINQAYDAGLVTFYTGLLSRRKVDLTEIGEKLCECETAEDIKAVLYEL